MTTYIPPESFHPHGRDVDFFLRLHRHLPDRFCGESPLAPCEYRPDRHAINRMNQPVVELKKDPAFLAKEKEVDEAVRAKWAEEGWDKE